MARPAHTPAGLSAPAGVTFTVNSSSDFPDANPANGCATQPGGSQCTLRGAIQAANVHPGADTIQLQANTPYYLTRGGDDDTALNGDLDITESVTLLGAGPGSTIIDGAAIGDRVFQITGTVTISGVTIQHGQSSTEGGGLINNGRLTLINSYVVSNSVSGFNDWGGGMVNYGALTLTHSLVSGNATGNHNAYGGGILNETFNPVTLIDSTVSNNLTIGHPSSPGFSPGEGGGIYGPATLINSTVSGNTGFRGGGLYKAGGTLTLINSTVSGNNSTESGGGIFNEYGQTQLLNTTVTQNRANSDGTGTGIGGGVLNGTGATFTVASSIVALNTNIVVMGQGLLLDFDDCAGNITSGGNNLVYFINSGHCSGLSQVPLADPLLGPLQDNGGPTFTHALLPGSPAIDAVNGGGCTDDVGAPLTTDQRGQPRPANGAGLTQCDIGAYELQRVVSLPLVRR